jgi:molybdopterin-guanine dinucleotide biosynthesis protein A
MGRPKAWLPVAGEPMLLRVVGVLSDVVSPVVVVAADGQDVPPLPTGVELVRDPEPDRGPLQGLAAGLAAVADRADAAFVAACDLPFLSPALVRTTLAALDGFDAAVPETERPHPLAAAYRVGVLQTVEAMLAAGERRMTDLLARIRARRISVDDPALLRNVNTPEEYDRLAGD